MIGRLQRVGLREVWDHEARDFTPWLEDNIDVLNDVIDLSLSIVAREQEAGDFSVDLVAEDESGNSVIIENQFGQSDHDHLGKLITYLTEIGANVAIWIVETPRPEHIRAISRLNESCLASFYLLKLEAVRIGDSSPAPLITLIAGSSAESPDDRHIRFQFWTQLLERAQERTPLYANISPSERGDIRTAAGERGLTFNCVIGMHTSRIELYIDRDTDADSDNEEIFDTLEESKADIENAFGEPLEWQRLEGRRACRISQQFALGGYRDNEEEWPEIQDAMIDGMIRLEAALRPYIGQLQVSS